MADCCSPGGCRWILSKRDARADARRYRKRGLDAVSGSIVALLRRRGVQDRDVLEVGGGVGGVGIELLRAGVRRVVNVELTPTYEEVALDLLREAGFEAQVERRLMDFAEAGADVPAADVVVLNRVICCYPDMPRLAGSPGRAPTAAAKRSAPLASGMVSARCGSIVRKPW